MSIHLVGGGWSPAQTTAVFGPFLDEATAGAARESAEATSIVVLLVGGTTAEDEDYAARYRALLGGLADVAVTITRVSPGETFEPAHLAGAHGLVIGGGTTPDYLAAVQPIAGEIRRLAASGLPYLGFSAGAAIAAERALVGGWRIGDVPVCAEDAGEGLEDVAIEAGLGLVDLTIEVHAAQWGTLARLLAATEAGLVDGGVAIDEDTAFVVGEQGLRVEGAGNVWSVRSTEDGVLVRTLGA